MLIQKEHIQLHAEIRGTERIERWEYPIEAIREAVTNAICVTETTLLRIFKSKEEKGLIKKRGRVKTFTICWYDWDESETKREV